MKFGFRSLLAIFILSLTSSGWAVVQFDYVESDRGMIKVYTAGEDNDIRFQTMNSLLFNDSFTPSDLVFDSLGSHLTVLQFKMQNSARIPFILDNSNQLEFLTAVQSVGLSMVLHFPDAVIKKIETYDDVKLMVRFEVPRQLSVPYNVTGNVHIPTDGFSLEGLKSLTIEINGQDQTFEMDPKEQVLNHLYLMKNTYVDMY